MSPQDTLRRAILNDEFPDDPDMDRLFTPVGEDLLKLNRNIALSAWMSQVSKSDINAGSPTWQADKDALVQGYFKNPTASNVSDEQLHSLVKTHIQTSEEAADMAANMALQGKTSFEALKELNTKRGPSLVRPIWDNYTKDLVQRHSVLSQKLAPYRGIVDSAASKLSKEMEWSLPTTQKFQEVATQLLQVPEEDRHLVISAIGATGGATAEERASYLSKLAGAMGRMTETLGSSSVGTMEQIGTTFDQLTQMPEAIASALSGGVTMQGELASSKERSQALLKAKEDQQAFQILTQQIRQVADSEVSPIKGDNWWSQTGIDVARMAPQVAVTVANPIIGTAANLSYFRATVAAEAKQEDPSLTYQQADTIGALTAPFNAAIETVTALIPFGKVKLPFVQKWLSTTTTSVKGAARNLVIRGAFGVASEVGEEMAQAVAPLWTQELLGALSKDMSGVDWEKRMPDFSKIAAQTWGPALVFALVGGGAASINDIKNGRALASDRDTMVATGMAPAMADQIATAAESGDWSKADSLFRQEFTSTTKATDEEKTAAVARIIETQKAQDGFRSSSERGADELERAQTIEKAIESLSQARVFRDAEGWAVEDTATNEVVRVGSREEAANLAYSRLDDNAREEAQAMAKVFEAYSAGADILDLDLGRTMDLSETGDTEAAMKEAAMTEAMLNGMSREQAEKVTWTVLGSNRLETVEGVRRAVSRLFSGASVMDAIEEPVEARFQAGLEQGVFTSDEALNFVRIAAEVMKAPELVTTAESSSRGLTEAISDIVMADTFGQRKDGRKGVAGAVTAGLKAKLRRQVDLTSGESKFAAFLAAFRHFFKQVFKRSRALLKARKEGKLSNDFDEFLDTLMNVDPQRRHEAAAAKEALEIAQAGNMAFSLTPKGQDAEYLAAVEAGDMEKAQRMVDKAAGRFASLEEQDPRGFSYGDEDDQFFYHVTTKDRLESIVYEGEGLSPDRGGQFQGAAAQSNSRGRVFFTERSGVKVWLGQIEEQLEHSRDYEEDQSAEDDLAVIRIPKHLVQERIDDDPANSPVKVGRDFFTTRAIPAFPDAVVRDESGQVIPLSQRFNPETNDIRFSLAPRSLPEVADTILAAQMKKPAFFEAFVTLARRKMDKLRKDGDWRVDKRGIASRKVGFDTRMAGVRSADNIENERKFRLRSRQRELIDAGMLALAPETLAAYDAGVASLEDVPMVKDMLGKVGKIMSKGAAQKSGKLKTDGVGSAGDYDGAPRLPPAWYAKSGGSMPYEIAQQLHDLGHLNDAYADTLWEALRSAIYSTRTANEAFKKARDAVRKVETDALAQAKKETDTWAKVETAKIPTEKERQMMALRTLDAILSAFPPEIRAKVGGFVKLASFSTDAAREAEIIRRLAKLEEVIEDEAKKHYAEKIEKLFKRFAPKKEAGKKATGQLDPDAQELVDAARAAMGYDDTRTRAELAAIDSMLAEDGITPDREVQLERQRELVQLFGDFDNAESTRMESAADALEDTATEGWAKWKLKKIMERERRTEARQALIADTGKPSIGKERDKQNKWAKTKFGKAFSALLNVSSFSELLRFEFGEKSATARKLEDQERAAAYAYEDAMQAFGDRVGDFFAELAGGRLAGEQLRFDLAQPMLTVGTGDNERTISQLQGIQALLMWQQEDGRRHMEGSFDENGKPSGKWHYGEEWIADLESKLSPEAYQVKSFLEQLYAEEYQPLNAIYRQRHGVNLPKNERYSPITVQPMQATVGEMVDPVSGFAVTGSILTPGGLRTRNKRAVAEPRFDDAVQIFLGHSRQMEHWKAYYDFATEAQAILLNREVTNAVEAKGSTQAVTVLKKWVDQFAQGGSRDAQSGLEVSSVYSRASGRAARVALLGRISTLLIQSGQLAAASVKMPVGSYLKRLGMLLSGNLDYTAAVNSPFIQRRYRTAPPIVQQALAGVGDAKRPGVLSSTTPRILGNALSGADALFTGGTYAIILDYHRSVTGPAMGLQGAELEAFAQAEAERDTEAVAQPVRPGTRSVFENSLPIWGKTGFAFASEARQKFTLAAWAAYNAKKDPAQAAKVAFLTFIVGGLVTQVLKNLWREAKDDDDEKMWSAERLVKATIAGPLHGVPGVSELMGDPGLFSGFKWSSEAVKKIATKAMDDDLDEVTMRDVENALSAAGYFNDTAAGIAGLSHLGFDFAKILQALAEED